MNLPDGDARKFAYDTLDVEPFVGRLLKDGDTNKVVLGYNFYVDKVGLDKVIKPGKNILIQNKSFEVVGIMDKKGSLIFDNIVLMNEEPLEDLMGYGDKVDIIVARVQNPAIMDKTKEDIEKALRRSRNVKVGEENFEVSTPEAALGTVNSILGGIQAFIVIIALISVFVGAIGIVNTMTTSVMERRKEIGIMKSIGATNGNVFMQFFIEAGLLGLIGGISGAIFGTAISVAGAIGIANFIGSEPIWEINYLFIAFVLFCSFLIGAASGIAPAMNAAKQNPVEALRS
jgi:putative ABC transport system permease protein